MAYLDETSIAASPYVARCNKAFKFYLDNRRGNSLGTGLYLAVASGDSNEWVNSVPLPSLNTYDLTDIQVFIRYRNMYMVKDDVDGNISVGTSLNSGDHMWSKVDQGANDDEYFKNVITNKSRWVYVDFEIKTNYNIPNVIRQFGIYSYLRLMNGIDPSLEYYSPSTMVQLTSGPRKYDGILELVHNKESYYKSTEIKEILAYVLEF